MSSIVVDVGQIASESSCLELSLNRWNSLFSTRGPTLPPNFIEEVYDDFVFLNP